MIRLIGPLLLAAVLAGCSSTNDPNVCHAGCLCFTTPQTCPTGCYPTYQETDGGTAFFCSNAPPPGTDGGRVPASHRPVGSMCRKTGARALWPSGLIARRAPSRSQPAGKTVIVPPARMVVAWRLAVPRATTTAPTTSAPTIRTARATHRARADRRAPGVGQTPARPRAIAASTPTADRAASVHPAWSTISVSARAKTFCPPGDNGCSETGPDGVTKQVPCSCYGNCGHGYFCHTAKDSCHRRQRLWRRHLHLRFDRPGVDLRRRVHRAALIPYPLRR